MGDAKKRGPYERRKAEALKVSVKVTAPGPTISVGDSITWGENRLLVTEVTKDGFKGNVVPPESKWSNYGA
jgi:hypothetical protein